MTKKISQLIAYPTALTGVELLEIETGGASYKVEASKVGRVVDDGQGITSTESGNPELLVFESVAGADQHIVISNSASDQTGTFPLWQFPGPTLTSAGQQNPLTVGNPLGANNLNFSAPGYVGTFNMFANNGVNFIGRQPSFNLRITESDVAGTLTQPFSIWYGGASYQTHGYGGGFNNILINRPTDPLAITEWGIQGNDTGGTELNQIAISYLGVVIGDLGYFNQQWGFGSTAGGMADYPGAGSLRVQNNVVVGGVTKIKEQATPATPAAGTVLLYAKSDHKMYSLGSDGIERALS